MNNQPAKFKIFKQALKIAVLSVFLAFFVITSVPVVVAPALAQSIDPSSQYGFDVPAGSTDVQVEDMAAIGTAKKGFLGRTLDQIKSWGKDLTKEKLKIAGDIAWKAALKNFLNNLAYDTATYLATGNKGQLPMFQTQGWGGYLQNAADNAAGTFIEELGKNMGTSKLNLCSPNFNVLLKINLGLVQSKRPKKPLCTFSQMTKNWDKALTDKNFLPKFQDMFNPWSNDLGIALTLQTGMTQTINEKTTMATKEREEGQGWLSVKDLISGNTKTPASQVRSAAADAQSAAKQSALAYTGSVVADSIDIFINTLAGKLIEKWLKGGLVSKFPKLTNKLDDLNAQNPAEGAAGAKDRMKTIVEPNFKVRADYDILAELVVCPDPNKAGPTDCVIDEKFRQAIEKKLTVGQALEQGYLNGNGIFGFTSDELEPKFNEGYPYRSMLILRKYRIIPVGWEVAAQKIKDNQGQGAGKVDGTKNLSDLTACFKAGDPWCKDLVDPDWVLKAPQNFCKREGAGPQILSEQVTGQDSDSSLAILRNDTYCADEQSCIKEKTDGSCRAYGYCTEERRKWDFNGNSCEPLYNTCQSFSSAAGQQVSYLENTLDFEFCNAGNAGCQKYARSSSVSGSYNPATKTVDWSKSADYVHLNKQAESCDKAEEGCRQLIRTKAGLGANLLINADFEAPLTNSDWVSFGIPSNDAYQGSHSLKMNGVKSRNIPIGSNLAGESWTLSFYAKNCAATDTFQIEDKSAKLTDSADWTRYSLSYVYPGNSVDNTVNFTISSLSCLIDNIKLERGSQATNFSDYAAGPSLIQEKLLPNYLFDSCYSDQGDHYELKPNAPAICSNFARQCKEDEAGCELYTSVAGDTKIPAKVALEDYCPVECVGYNTFVQSATTFDSSRPAYFIPQTAKTCSAEAVGCDEFTNLEKISTTTPNVAEKKEYYSSLRQCVKKSNAPASGDGSCAEFYNWEGSDESGYQLKVESFEAIGAGLVQEPVLTEPDNVPGNVLCSEAIYNLPPADPAYNADCRQFYNRAGGISYHLYSRTIDCTDDCHPYRRTALNVDENITSTGGCTTAGGHWDTGTNQCVVCQGGGIWSSDNNGCIYMAVPDAGTTCAAAQNGCREYVGNTGNNVRQIFTDDFFAGVGGWSGAVKPSSEGINLGPDNRSHSLEVISLAERQVGNAVSKGFDYVISFVAKAATVNQSLTFSLVNGSAIAFFSTVNLTAAWQIFEIDLKGLNHEIDTNEILRVAAMPGGTFYIDSITLTEITDRFYLIKNSWRTPDSCDEDLAGRPAPLYMLGCDQYRDRDSKLHNLKQFSKLCSESAVGCELMIDTQNSSEPGATYYLDGAIMPTGACTPDPTVDCVVVPADEPIYAVYDPEKLCGADQKGCELLSKQYKYGTATLYGDIYLKNNPDQYRTILCGANAVGCDGFAYDQGEKFFKDPGDQVCEYRQQKSGEGQSYGWYKKKVKRCGGITSGEVCLTASDCQAAGPSVCTKDADCGTGSSCVSKKCYKSCLLDNSDIVCPVDTDSNGLAKTLGLGGAGGTISQPSPDLNDNNWVGLCAAADSGCTEYLDPASKFNSNLIFNGSFQVLATSRNDGWNNLTQSLTIEPNTAYRLATEKINNFSPVYLKIHCPNSTLYALGEDNQLSAGNPGTDVTVTATNDRNSQLFYYKANASAASASCTVTAGDSKGAVELKKVAVDYQLAQNLDSKTCNGIVDTGQGCVLFNERRQSGAGLAALNWDADTTNSGNPPANGAADADKDSNIILKVAPDRVCDKWLACQSYIKDSRGDNVCFDIGLCDAVDQNGNCQSFIPSKKANQVVGLDAAWISNLSGYAKVGIQNGSLTTDYYPFGAMEQQGEVANMPNGGFEYYGSNLYPIGWTSGTGASWNVNLFSVINNPVAAQAEGIGYAPEGASFLKLGSSYSVLSEQIDVVPGADYIITAYVNTINLKSGQARIDILGGIICQSGQCVGTGSACTSNNDCPIASQVIKQDLGQGWQPQLGKFNTGANPQIKIKLYGSDTTGAAGNFYYDDIKIKPALNSRIIEDGCWPGYCISNSGGNDGHCSNKSQSCLVANDKFWYTPQTCRLYPQSDSLACDYFESSGKRQKGWPGYCLEYDRRPGDPNTCLLWYPVDRVKGDGLEEGAGYTGKVPAYYCLDTTPSQTLEGGCSNLEEGKISEIILTEPYIVWNAADDQISVTEGGGMNKSTYELSLRNAIDHKWTSLVENTVSGTLRTWDVSNDFGQIEMFDAVRIKCKKGDNNSQCECRNFSSGLGITNAVRCNKVAQTVNSVGNNKFWSSRVYLGSDYKINSCNIGNTNANHICTYDSDSAPFGSIVPPATTLSVLLNPYEWDTYLGEDAPGNQPLYYKKEGSTEARLGQAIAKDQLKRLFAQSYGIWDWNSVTSCVDSSDDCDISKNDCPGGTCGSTTIDVCSKLNNIVCQKSCAAECLAAQVQEFRCGGDPGADKCCASSPIDIKSNAKTICAGGKSCVKNSSTDGYYKCGGVAAGDKCCPGGQACYICGDKTIIVKTDVDNATCGDSGQGECKTTSIDLGYYSCGGEAAGDRCCNPETEGLCGPQSVNICSGGSRNGLFCPNGHECPGSECVVPAPSVADNRYVKDTGVSSGWGPPGTVCSGPNGTRPVYDPVDKTCTSSSKVCCNSGSNIGNCYDCPGPYCDYCAIPPTVTNIKVNNVTLTNTDFINLTFNTKVDSQQLPLVMYGVDWGDDSKTMVSGVEMRDRPDPPPPGDTNYGNPHSLYHLYSYWDLRAKANQNCPGGSCNSSFTCQGGTKEGDSCIDCTSTGECRVKPKIQIKDNWGWCSGGNSINDCGGWEAFAGEVVVKEK